MNNRTKTPESDVRRRSEQLHEELRSLQLLSRLARFDADQAIEESLRLDAESERLDELVNELLKAS